eukprot:10644431-Karenia_brevis.AAC.1
MIVSSGVSQGCPLSGSPWAIAFHPILEIFQRKIEEPGLGVVRACADDVGCALQSLLSLIVIASIFRLAKMICSLQLKTAKCVLAPLNVRCTMHVQEQVRLFLCAQLPEWAQFKVAGEGNYLGVLMGPLASLASQWLKAWS